MLENKKLTGGMDSDSAPENIEIQDFISAYNFRTNGTAEGEAGEGTNLEGTVLISTTRPAGTNRSIGSHGFEVIRKGYSFIYNSNGNHLITELDFDTDTETILFTDKTDSGGIGILNLDLNHPVTDIKLVQDKFLLWTDNLNEIGCVNLERLKSGYLGVLQAIDIRLIKARPLEIPATYFQNDISRSTNLLHGNLIQVAHQFIYLDNEGSAYGSFSKRNVPTDESTPAIGTDVTKSNCLVVSVDAGTSRVQKLNIGARIGMFDLMLIKSIDRADVLTLTHTLVDVNSGIYEAYNPATNTYSFAFYNDELYPNIDVLETDLAYDHVPQKAGTIEILNGNELAAGDLTEGYPRPLTSVTLTQGTYNAGLGAEVLGAGGSKSIRALKTNSSYDLALAYTDAYGRYFPLSADQRYTIKIPSSSQLGGLSPKIGWQINDVTAPAGAVKYQLLMSLNNTHQNILWVNAVLNAGASTSDYFVFNLNSLLKFNTDNPSSILNYDYASGDRMTLVYKRDSGTDTYYNYNRVDVEVAGFQIEVVPGTVPVTNYLLKVRKTPDSVVSIADLTGMNVLMEIYTPRKQSKTIKDALFFEVGEQFDVIAGNHSVLSGEIKEGDVYLKTRRLVNTLDSTVGTYIVEDFNFSDFYPSAFNSYGRARSYGDEQGTVHLKASIRYSDMILTGSKYNGLSRFFTERIYGEGAGQSSSSHGAIGKLFQRDNYLICIQELKIGHIPVYASILEDQAERQNVAISDKILGSIRYIESGNWGMGKSKRSFASSKNGTVYFLDPNNSTPVRDGYDGVKPIAVKMSRYLQRVIQKAVKEGRDFVGFFDEANKDYNLSLEGEIFISFSFSEASWTFKDSYTINPATLLPGTLSNGTVSIDTTTGKATFFPATDYVGAAGFAFSFVNDGVTIVKNACGMVSAGISSVYAFLFTDLVSQDLSTVHISNAVSVGGNTVPVAISVTGGEYSVNGGAFTSAAGTVNNGDSVVVRQTSSSSAGTTTSTVLTIGDKSDSFDVTTNSADTVPDSFTFTDQTAVPTNTYIISNVITVSGINSPTWLILSGNPSALWENAFTGSWRTSAEKVTNGTQIRVKILSPMATGASASCMLTIGGIYDTFNIAT